MFTIETELIFTGYESRISKTKNKRYTLVKYLSDKGDIFTTMLKCDKVPLNQLDKVKVKLEVIPGRYVQINTVEISK